LNHAARRRLLAAGNSLERGGGHPPQNPDELGYGGVGMGYRGVGVGYLVGGGDIGFKSMSAQRGKSNLGLSE